MIQETKSRHDIACEAIRFVMSIRSEIRDSYALSYIDALEESLGYGADGVKVQLLYILNNLGTWRGELARQSKKRIKEYVKELQR